MNKQNQQETISLYEQGLSVPSIVKAIGCDSAGVKSVLNKRFAAFADELDDPVDDVRDVNLYLTPDEHKHHLQQRVYKAKAAVDCYEHVEVWLKRGDLQVSRITADFIKELAAEAQDALGEAEHELRMFLASHSDLEDDYFEAN